MHTSTTMTRGIFLAMLLAVLIGGGTIWSRASKSPPVRRGSSSPWRGGGADRSPPPQMGSGGSVNHSGKIEWITETRK